MKRSLVTMVAVVLVVSVAGWAWGAPESVMLELKGEPGQESRYATSMSVAVDFAVSNPETGEEMFSLAPRLSGRFVSIDRVLAVADNGDLTMGSQIESFDISLDAADLHARLAIVGPDGGPPELIKLPALPLSAVVSKRGRLVAIEGLEGLPIPPIPMPTGEKINLPEVIAKSIEQFSQPLYPDHPVRVGDKWEWELTFDILEMVEAWGVPMPPEAREELGELAFPIRSASTLAGFEEVEGVECAIIVAESPWELTMPLGPEAPEGMMLREHGMTRVTTWLDYAAGQKVREEAQVQFTMRAGPENAPFMRMDMSIGAETDLE